MELTLLQLISLTRLGTAGFKTNPMSASGKQIEKIFTGTGKEETQKLANDITDLVKKNPFERKANLLSNRAYNILKNESDKISISKEEVLNNIKNIGSTLNPVSEVDQKTLSKLNNKIKAIDENFPETLSGIQSKDLIKLIDKDIKSLSPKIGEVRVLDQDAENTLNAYKEIRRSIDVPLKNQSIKYAEAMKPTADATNVSEYLKRLTISSGYKSKILYVFTDNTFTIIPKLLLISINDDKFLIITKEP